MLSGRKPVPNMELIPRALKSVSIKILDEKVFVHPENHFNLLAHRKSRYFVIILGILFQGPNL